MKYPKLRELKEAVWALIKGPYTTRFPYRPHVPYERFRGKPEFDTEHCIGCGACAQVCPAKAIEFCDRREGATARRTLTIRWDTCIACGQCQANCPTLKGITLSREFELATTEDRTLLKQEIEKELIVCDCCGEIIAPYDQARWVAKRLGPLCFTNASLMLFYLRELGLALKDKPHGTPAAGAKELSRSDRIRILCPHCRREAILKS